MSGQYRNVSDVPRDLEGGRIVGVGETFELSDEELKSSHNKSMINEGFLVKVEEPEGEPPPAPSREELLARAKELGIEGRSKMRNDELLTAINAAEQEGGDR